MTIIKTPNYTSRAKCLQYYGQAKTMNDEKTAEFWWILAGMQVSARAKYMADIWNSDESIKDADRKF